MDDFIRDNSWMATLGPLIGMIILWAKEEEMLKGWQLFWASIGSAALFIGAWGVYQSWTFAQWRVAPFAILITVCSSSFTGSTMEHVADEKTKAGR